MRWQLFAGVRGVVKTFQPFNLWRYSITVVDCTSLLVVEVVDDDDNGIFCLLFVVLITAVKLLLYNSRREYVFFFFSVTDLLEILKFCNLT